MKHTSVPQTLIKITMMETSIGGWFEIYSKTFQFPVFFHCRLKQKIIDKRTLEILHFCADPENKATMFTTVAYLASINNHKFRSWFSSVELLDGNFEFSMHGITLKLYSLIFEEFNDQVFEMMSNGLTQRWVNDQINLKGLKRKADSVGPQVLTMENLSIGFQICFCMMSIACITFFVEILIS